MANGLFKYFSTDKDKLETFINGYIYLTPPKFLNDPWDFLARSETWAKEHLEAEGFYDMPEFRADVNSPINLGAEARDQQNVLSKLVGVVSLAEDPLNRPGIPKTIGAGCFVGAKTSLPWPVKVVNSHYEDSDCGRP